MNFKRRMIYVKRTDVQRGVPCRGGEERAKKSFGWFRWTFNISTPITKLNLDELTNADISWYMGYKYLAGGTRLRAIIDAGARQLGVQGYHLTSKRGASYWKVPVYLHHQLVKNIIKELAK